MFDHIDSDILNSLTQSELSIFRYIDSHQESVIKMSIQELAKHNYTSTATILRLCKKLGLDGYSELKYLLKNTSIKNAQPDLTRHSEKEIVRQRLETIENTSRLFDYDQLERLSQWLIGSKKVHLYAGGLSAPVLEYMQRFLLSSGRSCFFYHTAPLGYRAAGKMSENDLMIIASASGATPSVIRIAQIAKNSKATVVSITNLDSNPLSQLADLRFFTFIENRDFFGTDIKSRSPLFFIVNAILECYLYRLEQIPPAERSNHFDSLF